MKYIKDFREGDRLIDIYLCKHKQSAMTKNGKPYENVTLQDKTGSVDAKIWDPNSPGICDFNTMDYVEIHGEVTNFNGALQVNIKRARLCKEGEYNPAEYVPVSSKNIEEMYEKLLQYVESIHNSYLKKLLESFFVEDQELVQKFKKSSAAKTVHHGFVGGLLEHTLGVTNLCNFYCKAYPILNRDLLLTAAICHDIGKTKELSLFPENDYTDDGQLLGHIVMGSQMIGENAAKIEGFPHVLLAELQHCILAHHGKYEFGSPKIPALIEALALNYADDTDAKIETFTEILQNSNEKGWLGFQRLFESNLRESMVPEE